MILIYFLLLTNFKPSAAFLSDAWYELRVSPSQYHTTITKKAIKVVVQDYLRSSSICNQNTRTTIPESNVNLLAMPELFKLCFGETRNLFKFEESLHHICTSNVKCFGYKFNLYIFSFLHVFFWFYLVSLMCFLGL